MAYDVMPYAQAVLDAFPEKKKDGFDRVMEVAHLLMDGTVGTVCTTINSVFQMYALMQGKKEEGKLLATNKIFDDCSGKTSIANALRDFQRYLSPHIRTENTFFCGWVSSASFSLPNTE